MKHYQHEKTEGFFYPSIYTSRNLNYHFVFLENKHVDRLKSKHSTGVETMVFSCPSFYPLLQGSEDIPEALEYIWNVPEHFSKVPESISEVPELFSEVPESITEAPEHISEIPDTISEAPEHNSEAPETISVAPE